MKIFIDTSVLVEFEKNRNQDFLIELQLRGHRLVLNAIVASEYIYRLLGILGGKSPMSLCESRQIAAVLEQHPTQDFLERFELFSIPPNAVHMSIDLMKKHNLLPNDALILAACKIQNIAVLASHDTDFAHACRSENIALVSSIEDLEQLTG